MEVFMMNIGLTAKKIQIITEIAKVVHGPSYAHFNNGAVVNFEVYLHRPKKLQHAKPSYRTGVVTFPSLEVGEHFLRDCGGSMPRVRISMGYQLVTFRKGIKDPRPYVLEDIRRLPFIDPLALQKKENIRQSMEHSLVLLSAIQFGWDCRDEVFSIEYERSNLASCRLQFSPDKREFQISFGSLANGYSSGYGEIITITFSQIRCAYASYGSTDASLFFHLWFAPVFEVGPTDFDPLIPVTKRTRLCALLDEDHCRVAPYVSQDVRLLCRSPSDVECFIYLWDLAQGNVPVLSDQYRVEKRGIFSPSGLNELHSWLEQLEWPLAFHVDALVRNGIMDPKELLSMRGEILNLILKKNMDDTVGFMRYFKAELSELWFSEGSQARESVKECFGRCLKEYRPLTATRMQYAADDLFHCLHVTITPTMTILDGPFPEQTNRIIRDYPSHNDHFLRVAFVDENGLQFRFDKLVNGPLFISEHVGNILRNGLVIGGRQFDFLAYSQSALKDHAVWFVCPFYDAQRRCLVNASTIIGGIGIFDDPEYDDKLIYCPARYAARISQAFTATDKSISVEAEEIFIEEDIKRNGSCFTDGVGTVSPALANDIWGMLCAKRRRGFGPDRPRPRAFQIRFQGSKGMVSVDHTKQGRELVLRPSMIKFKDSVSNHIEIAGVFNKPGKMFLNRPLIMLLEGLGVPANVFIDLQRSAVDEVLNASTSVEAMAPMLENYGLGHSFRFSSALRGLAKLDVSPNDPFYSKVLEVSIFHILRDLKNRARIPVTEGWTLVGVADIHSYLKEGEVFVCLEKEKGARKYLKGPVCISRSPTIHPGDVQLAYAIGAPPADSPFMKERLQNTLVFSTKGSRSLPSCLGGGDLDGDVYNITTYKPLFPRQTCEAASYSTAKRKELDRPSTMNDVIDFIVEYINADNVGIIATTWLIIADQSEKGIRDADCLNLAQLHSDAVDYPKTGNPVPIEKVPKLKFTAKPDWNEPEVGKAPDGVNYYQSRRAIGQLYRDIKLSEISLQIPTSTEHDTERLTAAMPSLSLSDTDGALSLDDALIETVRHRVTHFVYTLKISSEQKSHINDLFWKFSEQLKHFCSTFTMSRSRHSRLSEEEAFIGTIKARTSQPKRRKELISKLREHTAQLVTDIRFELAGGDEFTDHKRLRVAWAAWELSLKNVKEKRFGARSFSWVALGAIFDAIKSIEEGERA
ncbi:RdRP-domain-containing protein [Phellopilus nigrolimitatus]|nr:RdRP-domain-containing protein [Phellopilus nigrolimitatus]